MTAALAAVGLTKRYGAAVGVTEIDLEVPEGARFGLLGPNGAGKTTLIRLALGLLRPTAGSVRLRGHDVGADRAAALAQVGYLPGELGLPGSLSGARLLDALGRLHPRPPALRDRLSDVLELSAADLGRPVRQYSRGMKQKLGLIAALQHDPPLAILDEPTSGLDPVVQGRLLDWLTERAMEGRTLVFSSHVLSEVEHLCDRVAMIRAGRLAVIEDLGALRAERHRQVRVRFAQPVAGDALAIPGAGRTESHDGVVRFEFSGDLAVLLARLAALPVADLTIAEPSLAATFADLYVPAPGDR